MLCIHVYVPYTKGLYICIYISLYIYRRPQRFGCSISANICENGDQILLAMIAVPLIDDFCDLIQTMHACILVYQTPLWPRITYQKNIRIF